MSQSFSMSDNIANLRATQPLWAAHSIGQRLSVIGELRRLLVERAPAFTEEFAVKMGKSRAEFAASEIIPLADACRFLERKAADLLRSRSLGKEGRPFWLTGSAVTVHREPFGLILIIGPSNYPLLLPAVQAIQALAAGNAVLVKPGHNGAAPMRWLGSLLDEAGLPPNLFEVSSESVDDARAALREKIDKVVLTGSAETGRSVLGRLAERVIPAIVELSGNDPVIVLPDADFDMTARALAYGLRLNGSATCIAPRRVILVGDAYEGLRDKLKAEMAAVPARSVSEATIVKLTGLIREARDAGADISGDLPPIGRPMTPVLIENVAADAPIARADIFAPVLMLFRAVDNDEAVVVANASPFALGASVFGAEPAVIGLADRIDAGTVCINDLIVPTADPRAPFCGRRGSGYGATRGPDGLLEMTRPKVVFRRKGTFRPHFDPQDEDEHEFLFSYLSAAHGRNWTLRLLAGMKAVRYMATRGVRRRPA